MGPTPLSADGLSRISVGTGYPDRLKGDEIPLGAQIISIVDVYNALTTTRSYRGAMDRAEAIARMEESRHWWRPDVSPLS